MQVERLAETVSGAVLEPGDDGYEEARRVWNGRFDRRPAVIVRCAGADDVAAAIEFARARGLSLAVKGGGHDYAGNSACEDGLLVDLSPMQEVRIDAGARRAFVEPGVTWRAFDGEAQASGLATTGGACSTAGVAGVALGGGSGHLVRRFGLTLDNLLAAEVVTADGRRVRADEEENPDLFWGLRGGGGNFGVVTRFEFRLHEVGPQVLAGQIVLPLEAAADALRAYRGVMADAPDELQCYAFLLRVPPLEAFPEEQHGKVALDLIPCWSGPLEEGEAALRPLRELGDPILDAVEPLPYAVLQKSFDDGLPKGQRYYSRAHYLDALPDAAIDTLVAHAGGLRGAFSTAYLEPMGGAVGRVDPGATAFPHRGAAYGFHLLAGWTEPGEDAGHMAWAREFHEAMAPHAAGGVYVNLLGDDEQERVAAAYGDNFGRLAELKRAWDPENVFRGNHNIEPAG